MPEDGYAWGTEKPHHLLGTYCIRTQPKSSQHGSQTAPTLQVGKLRLRKVKSPLSHGELGTQWASNPDPAVS